MIKLETEFVSGVAGFSATPLTYKQIIRNDSFAVYERSYNGIVKDYETIVVKVNPKGFQIFDGKPLEDDTEVYPSTGQFGFKAWSYRNKGAAVNHYNELIANSVKPEDNSDENEPANESTSTEVSAGHRGRKPKERKPLLFPVGKFTTKELAEFNKTEYQDAVFFINESISDKTLTFVGEERRNIKGKPSKVYIKTE